MTQSGAQRSVPWAAVLGGGFGVMALCLCLVSVAGVAGVYYFRTQQSGQSQPTVEYILDSSPRMLQPSLGGTRLQVAQSVLAEIVRPADPAVTAGLRVFGTGVQPDSCQDSDLLVPFAQSNQQLIAESLLAIQSGEAANAALAHAMIAAIKDLAATSGPHSLVVVTGGSDTCNPQAGELIKQEAQNAGIDLQLFVIGFEVADEDAQAIKGMAESSAGGTYLHAPNGATLRNILGAVQNHIDRPGSSSRSDILTAATPAAPPAYQSQTACDHPFLPLRPGSTWSFSSESGAMVWNVTGVTGDANSANAEMTSTFSDFVTTYNWKCTAQDGIVSYEFGNIAATGLSGGTFDITNESGAFILPPEQFVPGAAWHNNYTMNVTVEASGLTLTTVLDIAQQFVASDFEPVSVPAGNFSGLVVNGTSVTNITTAGIPSEPFNANTVIHYVFGTGIVRWQDSGDGTTNTWALTSYNVP